MFRDLKEYQDIAKIYADKVSKPENLEERRGTELSKDQIQKNREGLKNRIMYGNPEGKKPVSTSQSNRQKLTQQRQKQNKGRVEKQFGFLKTKPSSEFQGRKSRSSQNMQGKPKPEKKMSNIPVIDGPVNNPEYGKNMSRSKEDLNPKQTETETKPLTTKQKFNAKFIKKDKGAGFVKRGTPGAQRAENKEKAKLKAQAMAKARIAAKKDGTYQKPKTAQELAKERIAKKAAMNENALQEKKVKPAPVPAPDMKYVMSHGMSDQTYANTANKVFSGKSEIGKDGHSDQNKFTAELLRRQANTGKDFSGNPLYKKKEKSDIKSSYEYDAYDLVLEYLLSTEQAATIEEANYVMTEMDAETIQGIVEEQKKNLIENPLAIGGALGTAIGGGILINRMLKNKKKMEKGGKFKKGSTMDNIQKRNQMMKDAGM